VLKSKRNFKTDIAHKVAALKFFTDNRYASYTHSRYEAYKVISEETELPKWVLTNAIREAYIILNVEKS
jgi:hypothetical protein